MISYTTFILCIALNTVLWRARASSLPQTDVAHRTRISVDRNIPTGELDALHALYNATDGDNWTWPPIDVGPISGLPWSFTPDANPCVPGWYGVECTVSDPPHIKSIILPAQNLSGTLPNAIGHFPSLEKLEMRHNPKLIGTIPDIFGNLTTLRGLDLSHNGLTGTIPHSIGEDSLLESLVMYGNSLNSTLPASICNLTLLYEVNFANNFLHGTIPSCIDQLTQMRGFTFSYNNLTGSIPPSLGNLTQLGGIDFDNNDLTGTIPDTLGNLTNLAYIAVYVNKLSGAIPDSLCNLTRLLGLYFYNNTFTGQLPNCFSQLAQLQTFDANDNQLSGTLPYDVMSMPKLRDFSVRNSHISGPIPSLFGDALLIIELVNNRLTGTLPSRMFSLPILTTLEMSQNYFTGTIPNNINNSVLAFTLDFGSNYLTGTIPTRIGDCRALQFLLLDNNHLHGTLPQSLKKLFEIVELNVESNFLSGSLLNAVNSTIHVTLRTILLNDNQFTGQIPNDLFLMRNLQVFSAVSNCFYTRLTSAMCRSPSLITIALDGMRSGRACRTTLLGLTDSYYLQHPLEQNIPACLFQMFPLTTLHLSGNGLTGTLPNNITISPTLSDLSLSHNQLRGVIPTSFQTNRWANLDLSFNRLTGTLVKSFGAENHTFTHMSLSLENNRLSGNIPHSIGNLKKVSILGTNIFACDQRRAELPKEDPGRATYHCGSNSFDAPYFAWLVLMGICVVLVLVVLNAKGWTMCGVQLYELKEKVQKFLTSFRNPSIESSIKSLRKVLCMYDHICTISGASMVCIVLVLVPLYLAVAGPYGTYYHQYAWQASAALLSGQSIAVALMVLWILLLCVVIALSYYYQRQEKKQAALQKAENRRSRPLSSRTISIKSTALLSLFDRCLVYALFMSISLCVVIGVNILYVYVVLYKNAEVVVLVQILLAFFKLFWSSFCSRELMHWTASQISKSMEATESVYGREFHFVQLLVSLLNNLAIPCVVVAAVSPNCFYNVFVPPPTVRASYVYSKCAINNIVDGSCFSYGDAVGETAYVPPFAYNYECSSSIITYYAPAFVFLCITATFISPISQYICLRASGIQGLPGSMKYAFLYFVPKIMKPFDPTVTPKLKPKSPYFDANRAVILLFSYLGMLLTFGVVFPPLAAAFVVTILSTTYFVKTTVGNFICASVESQASQYINVLNAGCERMALLSVLGPSVWLIVTFSCLFYTLFLFDTLGNSNGFDGAYWVLIVMPLMPACLYILYRVIVRYIERNDDVVAPPVVMEDPTLSPLGRTQTSNLHVEMGDIYTSTDRI